MRSAHLTRVKSRLKAHLFKPLHANVSAAVCGDVCAELVTSPPPLPLSIREPVRCICSMQGTGFSCPSGVGGRPPLMKVVTGDILVDITGRNVSEYLLYTSDRLRLHR